jgi:hypothetical protein
VRGAALLIVLAVAGCGRSDDRAQIRGTVEQFLSGDAAERCAALSEGARAELVSQEAKGCAEAIGTLDLEPGEIVRVTVDIDGAIVDLSSGESAFVTRTVNGWRLSAVGCAPEDGPPTRYPMDCELKA